MEEFPENVETAASAPESAPKPQKKVPGRPFTKENAKEFALSAAQAKRRRKEARMKMLGALTSRLDLGEELVNAMMSKDEQYLAMIEKATRLVGLQYDQSEEGRLQNLKVDTKADISAKLQAPSLNITFKDSEPKA